MAIGDIIEVLIRYNAAGEQVENTLGFQNISGTGTIQDLVDDIVDHDLGGGETTLENWMHPMGTGSECAHVLGVDVVPGVLGTYDRFVSPPVAGAQGGGGDALPPQSALVLTFNTGVKGRSFRGRAFLAGQGEGHQNAGVWSTGIKTAAAFGPDALLERYGPSGTNTNFQWSVISRVHNQVVRPEPIATGITSYVVRPFVQNQRRRTKGVGS